MLHDLTTSQKARQKLLCNEEALWETYEDPEICALFGENEYISCERCARFFGVPTELLRALAEKNEHELCANGYENGKFSLKTFFATAMLLAENEKAKALRIFLLELAMDTVDAATGGGTKHISMQERKPCHPPKERGESTLRAAAEFERILQINSGALQRLKERE